MIKSSQPRCFFAHRAFARNQVKPRAVIFLRLLSHMARASAKITMPLPAHRPAVLPAFFRSCAADGCCPILTTQLPNQNLIINIAITKKMSEGLPRCAAGDMECYSLCNEQHFDLTAKLISKQYLSADKLRVKT
ncbi:hypothetical protein ACVW2L_002372 [Mucilaginibacter sp. HD30]